jgi:hypothetical protein
MERCSDDVENTAEERSDLATREKRCIHFGSRLPCKRLSLFH